MDAYQIAAIASLFVAALLAAGACWVAVRGMGGISTIRITSAEHSARLEILDERITREVKQRAGRAGAEKVAQERTLLEEAQARLLAQANGPVVSGRPSPLHARRR